MRRMILKKLILSGENKKDAVLEFKSGLNIITGDSDTGKTYAFQCLEYVLGTEKLPKNIDESKGYQYISLLIEINNKICCLERRIGDSKVSVSYDDSKVYIPCKHDPTNCNNLSRFLLNILLETNENVMLRKNVKNDKRTLSFRDLIHLCMVDETSIIAEGSTFQSQQFTEKTVRKSIFKYVVTGQDDADIIQQENIGDEKLKRAGVVQFLSKKKEELLEKIKAIRDDKNYKLYASSQNLHNIIKKLNEIREKISKLNDEIDEKQKRIVVLSNQCLVDESKIEKFQKLSEYYSKEIKKIYQISTYSDFVSQLPNLNCPVCGNSFQNCNEISKDDLEQLYEYYQKQTIELSAKKKEVDQTINDISDRLNENRTKIERLKKEIELLKNSITEFQTTLSKHNENIAIQRRLDEMHKALDIYQQELLSIEGDIVAYGEKIKAPKTPSTKISSSVYSEYCNEVKKTLEMWGFETDQEISFDPEDLDIIIGTKKRTSWGKGYRACFMSAMVIALMRYCH